MSEYDSTMEQPAVAPTPEPAPVSGTAPSQVANTAHKPWYRTTAAIVGGSVAAGVLLFGAGGVVGGTLGYAIGSQDDRHERDIAFDAGQSNGDGFGGAAPDQGFGRHGGQRGGFGESDDDGFGQDEHGWGDDDSDGGSTQGLPQSPNGNGNAPSMPQGPGSSNGGGDAAPSMPSPGATS